MDLNSKYESEVEAYVQGKMSAEAKQDFEKILDSNPKLKSEVEILLSLNESYNRKDVYDLKRKLEGYSQIKAEIGYNKISKKNMLWVFAVAASVIVALSVIYFNFVKSSSDDIYKPLIIAGLDSTNIQDPEYKYLLSTTHSRSISSNFTLSDSIFFDLHTVFEKAKFNEKELPKFIDYGLNLLNKDEFPKEYKESTRILLSRAYLLQNKPKESLEVLKSVPYDSKYSCFAQYYRSIAQAVLENFDDAHTSLKNNDCPEFIEVFKTLELKLK